MTDKNSIHPTGLSCHTQPNSQLSHHALSNLKHYQLCQQYGQTALKARRKFPGLLPEVNKRELWKKKGFGSIFEFAAKLAGVSEEQVRNVLNLDKKFADKPVLHNALVEGKISANKLIRIASVATTDNQEFWATQANNLSIRSLETLVRDEKTLQSEFHVQPAPQQIQFSASVELKPKTAQRLEQLMNKGIDVDQLLNELLDQHESIMETEKESLAQEQNHRAELFSEYSSRVIGPLPRSPRHIPIKIRQLLQKEHGTKCSVPTCHRAASSLHHTRRFAVTTGHDPRFLAPLCREHHEIAHKIDLKCNLMAQRNKPH